jgi:hypothetical protein
MAERVRVMVRLRPTNESERRLGSTPVAFASASNIVIEGDRQREHTFDQAFASDATQEEVFDAVGAETIDNVLRGYNGTILAYGQTGSGKTHTMLGPAGGTASVLDPQTVNYAHRGVIPRLADALFSRLNALDANEVSWSATVSIFELYKEQIFDSLVETPRDSTEYRIREDIAGGRGIYVENLFSKPCLSAPEVLEAIRVAANRRRVASTGSNETSSRSHSITVLSLLQRNHLMGNTVTASRLTLVDLAGSEKVGKTGAGGDRLKEAQSINLSLTLLGNVIYRLTDGKSTYIPYRDSKLTRLLQDSLGGNSCTTLLCCASPAEYNKEETISTIAFAARAKQITNKPRINRDLSTGELKTALGKALDEIVDLKERLALQQELVNRGMSPRRSATASMTAPADVQNGAEPAGSADEDMSVFAAAVPRMQDEIADLKRQLQEALEKLGLAEAQAEFHRQRANDADQTIADLQARLRKEETLFERRIAEIRYQEPVEVVELSSNNAMMPVPLSAPLPDVGSEHNAAPATRPARRLSRGGPQVRQPEGRASVGVSSVEARRATDSSSSNAARLEAAPSPPPTLQSATSRPTSGTINHSSPPGPLRRRGSGGRAAMGRGSNGMAGFELVGSALAATTSTTGLAPGAAELELRILSLEMELKSVRDELRKRIELHREDERKLSHLQERTESLQDQNDSLQKECDALRMRLETSERRGAEMKRILDALNIDVEEQLELERQRTAAASSEASVLRGRNDELREAQSQQEFLDLATAELMFKSEDMEALENEVLAIRFSNRPEDELLPLRQSCSGALTELDKFIDHVLSRISDRRFATANLETMRLNVISEAVELQGRVMVAQGRMRRD